MVVFIISPTLFATPNIYYMSTLYGMLIQHNEDKAYISILELRYVD